MVSMSTPAARTTFNASAVTSGPMPSPPITAIRYAMARDVTWRSGVILDLWRTTQLSRAAFERLQAEFDDLTTRGRIEVAKKIEAARLMGDLSENGDYHAAKDEQGHMEGRIRQLEHLLENAEIIEAGDEGIVAAGSIVTIVYEGDDDDQAERYLVGHMEEQVDDLDVISPQSPLGAALLGASRRRHGSRTRRRTARSRVEVLKVETA